MPRQFRMLIQQPPHYSCQRHLQFLCPRRFRRLGNLHCLLLLHCLYLLRRLLKPLLIDQYLLPHQNQKQSLPP